MTATAVSIPNAAGEQLSGSLELPTAGPPLAYALFAHCFTCSKEFKAPVWISQALAERKIATLRFDFPGLGGSGGDFADTTLTRNVSDVVSAAAFLRERHGAPQVLIGHSMGGATVLRAAAVLPEARLVATLAAPAEPGTVGPLMAGAREQAERDGTAELSVAGRKLRLGRSFFDDLAAAPLLDAVATLPAALLVFQSPADTIVPLENGERLFAAAPHPKSLISLEGAGHLFDRRPDCEWVADVVAGWCRRYLSAPP